MVFNGFNGQKDLMHFAQYRTKTATVPSNVVGGVPKGQLISKENFKVFIRTEKPTKIFSFLP